MPRLEFNWHENGGPKVEKLPKLSLGMELIGRGIRFQLGEDAKVETVDGVVHCRVAVPANPDHRVIGSPPDRPRIEEAAS